MLFPEYWTKYATLAALRSQCDVDAADWLAPRERDELARYRDARRREGWLLGRWLSKQFLLEKLADRSQPLASIEILSRDKDRRAVRPEIRIDGYLQPWCLSLSHTNRAALVAVSPDPDYRVGVDLAEVQDLTPTSLVFWFTEAERRLVQGASAKVAATCWAIKEAVYKACNTGESFVPRKVETNCDAQGSWSCRYNGEDIDLSLRDLDGHVAAAAMMVKEDAAAPVPELQPQQLQVLSQ